jgi:hypothetical protein
MTPSPPWRRCDKFFFLYKGHSYGGGSAWRHVFKREFGECCHPWDAIKRQSGEETLPKQFIGFFKEGVEEWKSIPGHECDSECGDFCKTAKEQKV